MSNFKVGDLIKEIHTNMIYEIIEINDYKMVIKYVNTNQMYYSIMFENFDKIEMEKEKMFTKNDLQTGDVVVRRNGDVEIFLKEKEMFIRQDGGWNSFENLSDNMLSNNKFTYGNKELWDIIKVFRPKEMYQISFKKYTSSKLVFDRDRDCILQETIMSISDIEKKLGVTNLKIVKEK